MSIRRSVAAAVFVAAVSAPTILGSTPALADAVPTPTGKSQPDAPVTDTPAADAPATEAPGTGAPATDAGTGVTGPEVGTPAPSGTAPAPSGSTSQEEDELRARLRQLIAEPGHGQYFHEEAGKALNGTVEDMRHFFDVLPTIIIDDRDIFITQVMSMSDHRGQLWRTIQNVLSGTRADRDHFLDVTWPAVRLQYLKDAARIAGGSDPQLAARARQVMEANDGGKALVGFIEVEVPKAVNDANWRKVLHALIRPGSSLTLDEAAGQALGADGAKAFLAGLDGISDDEIRVRISQAMSIGGPEVRKAVGHVLDGHTSASLRAFLLTGLAEAQARDTANAHQSEGGNQGTGGSTPGQGGTTVTPVSGTTTTTVTTTDTTAAATGVLASTGVDAPLGAITAAGATSVALGAALVASRRRRQQQS